MGSICPYTLEQATPTQGGFSRTHTLQVASRWPLLHLSEHTAV